MKLTEEQLKRYDRNIILQDVGVEGQGRLLDARVAVVGAGGLGSPCAFYLAAAGIGALDILDSQSVDLSNLQRQVLHAADDVNRAKVESARETLTALNPDMCVNVYNERLTSKNALDIIKNCDIVVDACDNYATRYLINDACAILGKPFVHGSVLLLEGHVTVFDPRNGPCYRCQYPEPPSPGMMPDPEGAGLLGSLPGVMGAIQASETIKLIIGIGKPLVGRLLCFDALSMTFREFKTHKDPTCPACGDERSILEITRREGFYE